MTHPLQLTDEPLLVGGAVVAMEKVVGSQLPVGLPSVEDVVGDDQDRVRHRHDRAFVAAASLEAPVLAREVGRLGADRGVGRLDETGTEPPRALPRLARPMLAGRLVVARAQPSLRREVALDESCLPEPHEPELRRLPSVVHEGGEVSRGRDLGAQQDPQTGTIAVRQVEHGEATTTD